MGKFKRFLQEATFGDEPKYILMVLDAIKNKTNLHLGANGKTSVQIEYSPELDKIYSVASSDPFKAGKLLKKGTRYKKIFKDIKSGKEYGWSELYKGQFSGASRKNSTASSDVNEVFTLFFLINNVSSYKDTLKFLQAKKGSTGILKGEGTDITYENLMDLIITDSSAEDDVIIGYNNAKAVKKDITKKIKNYFWCPRAKPNGVPSSHPSDIVLEFEDNTMMGYSNKAISGTKDETPKFNTSVTSFYKNSTSQSTINNIINDSWNKVVATLPSKLSKHFTPIENEKYTEGGSKKLFGKLGVEFAKENKDFYKEDFYYKYRTNFIKGLTTFLKDANNMKEFLNIIYKYTFSDDAIMLPYKLLIGSTKGSTIKEMSSNTKLKNVLGTNKVDKVKINFDGKSQSFEVFCKVNGEDINFKVTNRTRSKGGWSGKSLYMTTPGINIK